MLRWLRRICIFLLLLIYGRKGHAEFVKKVTRNCKKRSNRKHVDGITEALEDVSEIPYQCFSDTQFFGFSKDGSVLSFQVTRVENQYEYSHVSLDLPATGRFTASNSRPQKIGRGKLTLKMLSPMRRWRISFHGSVDHHVGSSEKELVHASVSLYWQCLADPFDHVTCPSKWQLARNLSQQSLGNVWTKLFTSGTVSYEQWGEMWGRIDIEGRDSQSIRLKGFRKQRIERIGYSTDEFVASYHLIQDEGKVFITNGYRCKQNDKESETFGYLTVPSGDRWATDQTGIEIEKATVSENCAVIHYPLQIKSNDASITIDMLSKRQKSPLEMLNGPVRSTLIFSTNSINGKRAYGVQCHETTLPFSRLEANRKHLKHKLSPQVNIDLLTCPLQESPCNSRTFAGGKGCNLSILKSLGYPVPKGICVSTHAFHRQIQEKQELKLAQEYIRDEVTSISSMQRVCAEAVEKFSVCDLSLSIASAIEEELRRTFGPNVDDVSFAVRSSGVSEDGTETSYAGQLDTVLNVKGLENIYQAVCQCWWSSLSYRAVDYRRQNGQPVIEPIAVVIQEMVDPEVAGVLFTNDPVTGNSRVMVINAAPGLGENVVSGTCNPDTIKLRRNKDVESSQVIFKSYGDYVSDVENVEGAGMKEHHDDNHAEKKLCVTASQIADLCRLGSQVEEDFGGPQDIEWAISHEGKLYVLQTRPITSLNEETEEELIHEFDTPMSLESECLTLCNISEVVPSTCTPLTADHFGQSSSASGTELVRAHSCSRLSEYAEKAVTSVANRLFLNMTALTVQSDGILADKQSFDIAITGRVLEEHTMDQVEVFKGGPISLLNSIKASVRFLLIKVPKNVKRFAKWTKQLESFSIGKEDTTALELYTSIDEELYIYFDVWFAYSYKVAQSLFPFGLLFKLLRGNNKSVSHENNADVALLMANCTDVLSAEVPRDLHQLAAAIAASDMKETFLRLPDDSCHDALLTSEDVIRTKYNLFLRRHGYRCINEIEFFEKSWASDPCPLMRALKQLVRSPLSKGSRTEDPATVDVIDQLQSPLSGFTKYFIRKVLLDKAKAGVAARELGKSVVIKTNSVFKEAYWRLADLMVGEGRLPNAKLLFFLTHNEIGELIETRSAALVRKARRRMQVFPKQNAMRFEKTTFGRPTPLSEIMEYSGVATVTVKGMPVSKGVVTGRACVVRSLDEADNIQKDDILICPVTDIGWSPYFPMLSGLVTEIGGLISHGAVIAREVGIPCIVNVTSATRLFKTGEQVKLDGLGGILSKLSD